MQQADITFFTHIKERTITNPKDAREKFGEHESSRASREMYVMYGVKHSAENCVCFGANSTSTKEWIIGARTKLSCTFIIRFASILSAEGFITCEAKSISKCKLLVSAYGLLYYIVQNRILDFDCEKLNELKKMLQDNNISPYMAKLNDLVNELNNSERSLDSLRVRKRQSVHAFCVDRFKVKSSIHGQEADNEPSHVKKKLKDGLEILNKSITKVFLSAENQEPSKYFWLSQKLGLQNSVFLAAQYVLLERVVHAATPSKRPGSFPSMRQQTTGGDQESVVVEDRSLDERVKSVDEYQSHAQPNVRFFKEFGDDTHDMLRLVLFHISTPNETVSRAVLGKGTDKDSETVVRTHTLACLLYQILMKSNHHTGIGFRSFIIPLQIEFGKNLLQSSQRALWEPLLRDLFLDVPKATTKLAMEAIARSLTPKVLRRFTGWVTQHNKIKYPDFMPWILTGDNVDIGNAHSKGSHGLHISICLNLGVKYNAAELAFLEGGGDAEELNWPSLHEAEKAFNANIGAHGDQFRRNTLVGLYLRAFKTLEEDYPQEHSTGFWDFETADNDTSTGSAGNDATGVESANAEPVRKWVAIKVRKGSKVTFQVDGAEVPDAGLIEHHEPDNVNVISRFLDATSISDNQIGTNAGGNDEGACSSVNHVASRSNNVEPRRKGLDEADSVGDTQEMLESDEVVDNIFSQMNLESSEANSVDTGSEATSSVDPSDSASYLEKEDESLLNSVSFVRGTELTKSAEHPPSFFLVYDIFDVKFSDVENVNKAISKVTDETKNEHPQKYVGFVSDGQVTSPQLARFISGNNRRFLPIIGMTHLFGNVTCQINKQTLAYIENQFPMVLGDGNSFYENWLTKGTLQQRTRATLARLLSMCMSFLLLLRKHHPSILLDVCKSLRNNDTAIGPKKTLYTFAGDRGTVEVSNVSEQLFEHVVEVAKHVEKLANEMIVIDPPSDDINPLVKVTIVRSKPLEFHLQEEDVSAGTPVLRFGKCTDVTWQPTAANSWLTKDSVSWGKTRHSFKNGDRIFCYRESTDAEWISIDSKDDAYKFRDDFCSNDELEVIVLPHFAGKTCKRKQFKLLYDTFESLLPILGLYTIVRHPFGGQEYLSSHRPISFDVTNQCPVGGEQGSCQCLTKFPMLYWLYELTKTIQPFNNYNYHKLILMFLISMTQVLSLPELPRSAILKYVLGNMSLSSKWGSNTCVAVDGYQEFEAVQEIKRAAMKRVDVTSQSVAILSKIRSYEKSIKSVAAIQNEKTKPEVFHKEKRILLEHSKCMFLLVDRAYNIVAGAPDEYQLPKKVATANHEKGTLSVIQYAKSELDAFVNQRTAAINEMSLMTHLGHLTERNGLALFLNQPKTFRYPPGFVRVQSLLAQVPVASPHVKESSPYERLQRGMQLRSNYVSGTGAVIELRSDSAMQVSKAAKSSFFQVLCKHTYQLQVIDLLSLGDRHEFRNKFGAEMQKAAAQNRRDLSVSKLMEDTLTKLARQELEVTIDHAGKPATNSDFQQVLKQCNVDTEPATLVVVDAIRFLYKLSYPTDVGRIAKLLLNKFARIASIYASQTSAPAFISMLFDIAGYNTLARLNVDLVRHKTVPNADAQEANTSVGESFTVGTEIHDMGHLMTIIRDKTGLRNQFFVLLFESFRSSMEDTTGLGLTQKQLFALRSVVIAGGFPKSPNNTPVLSLGRKLDPQADEKCEMYQLRERLVEDVLFQAEGERQGDRLAEISLAHVIQNQPNNLFSIGSSQKDNGVVVVFEVVDIDAKICTASTWVIAKSYNNTQTPINTTVLLNNAADKTSNTSQYMNMTKFWQLWDRFAYIPISPEEVGARVLSIGALLALAGSDHVEKIPLISYTSMLDQITLKFRTKCDAMRRSALQQNCIALKNPRTIVPASWKNCIAKAYEKEFSESSSQEVQFHTSSLIWYKATMNDKGYSFELKINYNFILMLYAQVWYTAKWATATVPMETAASDNQEACGIDFAKIAFAHLQRAKGSQQLLPNADQLVMRLLRITCQLTLFFGFPRHAQPRQQYPHFFEKLKGLKVGLTSNYSHYAYCLPGSVYSWYSNSDIPSSVLDLEKQQSILFERLRKDFPEEFLEAEMNRSNPLYYLACRIWRQWLKPLPNNGNGFQIKMKHFLALMGRCSCVSVSSSEMAYSWDAVSEKSILVRGTQLCLQNARLTGIQCVEAIKSAIRTFLDISSVRGEKSFYHVAHTTCKLANEIKRKEYLTWKEGEQCARVTLGITKEDVNLVSHWLTLVHDELVPISARDSDELRWEDIVNIKMNEVFKMIIAGKTSAKQVAGCFIEITAEIAFSDNNVDTMRTTDASLPGLAPGSRSKRAMDFQGDTHKRPNTGDTPDRMRISSGITGSTSEGTIVQQRLNFSTTSLRESQ